jgi:ribosome-associated translation inhibitor RaiA
MNITTTARHCTLDGEDKRFAQLRLEKITRFLRAAERDRIDLHLVVTGEKNRHQAEITLRVRRHELVSREGGLDARAAIGLAADGLEDRAAERRKGGRVRGDGRDGANGAADGAEEGLDGWYEE